MTPEAASSKAADLSELVKLTKCEAWDTIIVPFITKARDTHLDATTAKGVTPAARAEHIEAYHLAKDLLELVPDKIASLRKSLVDFQAKGGEATFKVGDALTNGG